MAWNVLIVKSAEKQIRKMPAADAERVRKALLQMRKDPFAGDIVYLKGEQGVLRRRVGNWRILFEILTKQQTIVIQAVLRRTSKTY